MTRTISLFLGALACLSSSSVAFAQDTWTGFYAGGNVGYSWGDTDISYSQDPGIVDGFGMNGAASALASSSDLQSDSIVGGLHTGYDLQTGQFVMGLVTDFSWRDGEDENVSGALNSFGDTLSLDAEQKWLGTLRARAGMAVNDSLLLYASGGLAYGKNSISVGQTINGFGTRTSSESDIRAGWVVGGGAEYQLSPQWTVGAEYLYVDLGKTTLKFDPNAGALFGAPAGAFPATKVTADNRSQIARITFSFRF